MALLLMNLSPIPSRRRRKSTHWLKYVNHISYLHNTAHSAFSWLIDLQVTAALVILWMATNFFIKMLMLFFYRRIFMGLVFDVCNWTLMGLSVVWFIYAVLSWFLYCGSDLKADFEGPWVGCPLWGFQIQMGVFALDSFIDLCLLLLPIPFVSFLFSTRNVSRKRN